MDLTFIQFISIEIAIGFGILLGIGMWHQDHADRFERFCAVFIGGACVFGAIILALCYLTF